MAGRVASAQPAMPVGGEIMNEIAALDAESAEVLARIKALL